MSSETSHALVDVLGWRTRLLRVQLPRHSEQMAFVCGGTQGFVRGNQPRAITLR